MVTPSSVGIGSSLLELSQRVFQRRIANGIRSEKRVSTMSDDNEDDDTSLSWLGLSQISVLGALQLTYRKYCDPLVGDWVCFGQEAFVFLLSFSLKVGLGGWSMCKYLCMYTQPVHVGRIHDMNLWASSSWIS